LFSAGVGKTAIAQVVMKRLSEEGTYLFKNMMFSAQTSSARTQAVLESQLEKKRKGLIGAPVGFSLIVFVDDVNMPAPDAYGSQPPIQLLRYRFNITD